MIGMAKRPVNRGPGRPAKPPEEKAVRAGKSYTAWFDAELWERLEKMMAGLPYSTEYKEHIEIALEEYLTKRGFGKAGAK